MSGFSSAVDKSSILGIETEDAPMTKSTDGIFSILDSKRGDSTTTKTTGLDTPTSVLTDALHPFNGTPASVRKYVSWGVSYRLGEKLCFDSNGRMIELPLILEKGYSFDRPEFLSKRGDSNYYKAVMSLKKQVTENKAQSKFHEIYCDDLKTNNLLSLMKIDHVFIGDDTQTLDLARLQMKSNVHSKILIICDSNVPVDGSIVPIPAKTGGAKEGISMWSYQARCLEELSAAGAIIISDEHNYIASLVYRENTSRSDNTDPKIHLHIGSKHILSILQETGGRLVHTITYNWDTDDSFSPSDELFASNDVDFGFTFDKDNKRACIKQTITQRARDILVDTLPMIESVTGIFHIYNDPRTQPRKTGVILRQPIDSIIDLTSARADIPIDAPSVHVRLKTTCVESEQMYTYPKWLTYSNSTTSRA